MDDSIRNFDTIHEPGCSRAADIVIPSRKKHRSIGTKMNRVQWNDSNINSNHSQLKSIGCDDASTDTEIAEVNQELKSDVLSYGSSLPQEVLKSNNHSMPNKDIKMRDPRKQSTAMTCLENALNEMSMAIRHVKMVNKHALTFSPQKSYRGLHEEHDMSNWRQRLNKKIDYIDALVSPRMYDTAPQRLEGTHIPCNSCEKSDISNYLCGTEIRTFDGAIGPRQIKVGHQSQPRTEFQQSKIGHFHQQCHSLIPCYTAMGNIQQVASAPQETRDKMLDTSALQIPRSTLSLAGGAQDLEDVDLHVTYNSGLGMHTSGPSCKFSANRGPGLHHRHSALLPDQRVPSLAVSLLPGFDQKSSSSDWFPSQQHRNAFQQRTSDQLRAAGNVQHACAQPNNQHQSNIDCGSRQSVTAVCDSVQHSCGPSKLSETCLASASSSDVYSISKWCNQACPYERGTALGSAKSQAGSLYTTQHSKIDAHQETSQSPNSIQGFSVSTVQHSENGQYQINSQEIQNFKTSLHARHSENPLETTECENSHFNCSAMTDIGEEVNGFRMKNVSNSMMPGEQMSQDIERNTLVRNVSKSSDLVMPAISSAYKDAIESNKMKTQTVTNQQLPLGLLTSTGVTEVSPGSDLNDGKKLSSDTLPKVQVSDIAELVNQLRSITSGEEATLDASSVIERSYSESGNDNADSFFIKKSSGLQVKLPVIDEVIPMQIKNCSMPTNKTELVGEPAVLNGNGDSKNVVELQYVNLLTGDGTYGSSPITLRSSDGEVIILGKERQSSAGSVTLGGGSEAMHRFNDKTQSDKALNDFSNDSSSSKIPGSGPQSLGSSTNGKGDVWSVAILKPGAPAQIFKFRTA